jgi:hypothetical protein
MKSPRDVYQKLREVKYHHLIRLYKKFLKKIPDNCRYNVAYKFPSDKNTIELRLCLLHQPNLDLKAGIFPHLVDVCQEPAHCVNCNAFVLKHTKESIKTLLEEELKDQNIKQEKYADVCALEWVLEQSIIGIPPFIWIQKIYYQMKRYASKGKII